MSFAPASGPIATRSSTRAIGTIAVGFLLLVIAALVARVSIVGLVAVGVVFIALVGYAAMLWPRAAVVVVVLSPILDRYLVAGVFPVELQDLTHFVSEGLLLAVTGALLIRAVREGTLLPALRHPVTPLLLAMVALAAISAVVNGVPIEVAAVGLLFTLDAAVLFFLPRLLTWTGRQAAYAIGAFVAVVAAAALVTLAQALLSPYILGLDAVPGRFGEVYRLAAFVGDPNVFGTFLVTAAPFSLLAATQLREPRLRWAAIGLSFLLVLALWLSFSRGSWLAMIVSSAVVYAIVDRRALLLAAAIIGLTFVTAIYMPRDLLIPPPPPPENGEAVEQPERPNVIDSTIGRVGTIGEGRDLRTLFVLNALPILADHPLLGVGPGRYGGAAAQLFGTPVYAEYATDELLVSPTQRTVDNFWLHLTIEAGILGIAAFLAAALVPGLRILNQARSAIGRRKVLLGGMAAGLVGIAVSSVSTMMLEANSVAFVFWFLLGLGSLLTARRAEPDEREPLEESPTYGAITSA